MGFKVLLLAALQVIWVQVCFHAETTINWQYQVLAF